AHSTSSDRSCMCFKMNSPATSRVGNGGWPGPEVHTLANRPAVEKLPIDLARQPHQRMSKIDDVLERRSQQILLTIVSRLRHRAPNADDPPRNRTKRRKPESQFARNPALNPRFLAKTVISDPQ